MKKATSLPLFDADTLLPGLSRRTDPATSRQAAEHMVDSGKLDRDLRAALEALRKHPGLTAAELERVEGVSRDGKIRKRLATLRERGLARNGHDKVCVTSGRMCQTWFAV